MIAMLAYILIAFVYAKVLMLKDAYERLIAFVLFTLVFTAYIVFHFTSTGQFEILGILIIVGFFALYVHRGFLTDFDTVFGLNKKGDDN